MLQQSAWGDQKAAAYLGVPRYAYRAAPGYVLVPVPDFQRGYATADGATENQFAVADTMAPNLPFDYQGLYKPHENLDGGYYGFSESAQRLDFAPFFPHRPIWANQQLKDCNALNRQPLGIDLNSGVARARQVDFTPDQGLAYTQYNTQKQFPLTGTPASYFS